MTDSTSVPLKHHMVKKCALLAVMALEALRIIYFMVKTEAIADQLQDNIKQPITEDDRVNEERGKWVVNFNQKLLISNFRFQLSRKR